MAGVLLPVSAAMSLVSASEMLINFSRNVPTIQKIVEALAFLTGVFFVFRALLKLKIYGEMRTMMSPHARLNQVLLLLFSGVLLLYLSTTTLSVMTDTLFGSPVIKDIAYSSNPSMNTQVQYAGKKVIQLIGMVSVFRGIIQLASYQEGGQRSIGKAITHIISGAFAVNVEQSIKLLDGILGS